MMMDRPSETHPNCIKCGLFNGCTSPFMESAGSDEPVVLVIGEAPGSDEDRKGEPFVGQSGQLLRNVLTEVGYDISKDIRFTNVVRCRPTDNKITKQAINCCKQFAVQDIETYNPAVVMLLGNSPLNGILGQTGISQWSGVIIEKNNLTYLPLFHPAYILRNQNALDEWIAGMMKAIDGHEENTQFTRTFPKTTEDLKEMLRYLDEYEYISFDTETSSLDAFSAHSKIISCSFAAGDRSFSFPIDHPQTWFTGNRAIEYVKTILLSHDGCIIAQNTKFDQMQVFGNLGITFKAGGDSMLVSHLLDSRPGIHGLKRLAGIHLGMYEYEQELTDYIKAHKEADPRRGGSYANIPLEILLPYGAMDAEAALMVHDKLYPELSEKQKILYDQMILPVSDVLCAMQCNGIALDTYIAQRYEIIYKIKREEANQEILKDKYIKKFVKEVRKDEKKKGFKFNPNSFVQLQQIYYHYYKMPIVGKQRPDGSILATTSGGALKHMEPEYPILRQVRYYKLLNKMITTYLTPAAQGLWLSGDGRVRTTFNLHGAVTGRLSSSGDKNSGRRGLNLQNIPTKEKEPGTLLEILPIKNIFTHSYVKSPLECIISTNKYGDTYDFHTMYGDGVIMSVDQSGMELRVFASLANCQPMIEIHKSGKDFHSCVALRALTGKPISDITREEIKGLDISIRYKYKWTNWTLLFGGGAETLHHLYDMPYDEAEQMVSDYFQVFPEVKEFQDACVRQAEDFGYIESPYGRREHLYYINDYDHKKRNADRRAAMNMPVQSGASDTVLIALVIVADKLSNIGSKAKLVNTVHDSIVLDVPKEEILPVATMVRDVMENVVMYAKYYMPDIDMSWLQCPLKADVDVGSHYGSMISIEDWSKLHV